MYYIIYAHLTVYGSRYGSNFLVLICPDVPKRIATLVTVMGRNVSEPATGFRI